MVVYRGDSNDYEGSIQLLENRSLLYLSCDQHQRDQHWRKGNVVFYRGDSNEYTVPILLLQNEILLYLAIREN